MDDFARRPAEDRRAYIEEAAARRGLTPIVIEKDFWVCWTLRRLVNAPELKGQFIFKGGTSLSKAYGLIHRFSEDIDLTIDRTAPKVRDVKPPMEDGISGNERQRRCGQLKEAAQSYVDTLAKPALIREIKAAIGTAEKWSVTLDQEDPDRQTILFNYPRVIDYGQGYGRGGFGVGEYGEGETGYIKPRIKLEFGARGDTEPAEPKRITPYLAEEFPEQLPNSVCELATLDVVRTFWEKVTILHALYHNGKLRPAMSRHYHDTLMLARAGVDDRALDRTDLLEQVVRNKGLMFADKSAQYDHAVPGSLNIRPSGPTADKLKQDYAAMTEMFMTEPPSFDELMAGIQELEAKLNR